MKVLQSVFNLKFLIDGACFALAKGTAFLVPLLAVRLITLSDYGFLETSFAWGQQLTTLIALGIPAAYPFFILKRKETAMQFYFWADSFLLFIIAGGAGLLYLAGMIASQPYFVLLLATLFAMQRILSSILKTHNFGRIGVLVDSFYYFGLGIALFIFWLIPSKSFFTILFSVLFGGLALLAVWSGIMLKARMGHFRNSICFSAVKKLLFFSVPLIFSGVIIYWLVACSRIYLSWLLGNEVVGIYSFCFRFFAISILIYQFSYIMFFRKLYIASPENLDRNFSLLLGLVFVCSVLCFIFFFSVKSFFPAIRYKNLILVLLELCCFMPIWCATALNEGIIARENRITKMNVTLLPQIVLFPLLVFWLRSRMTLEFFCLLHLCSCSLVFFSQTAILYKCGIRLVKSFAIINVIALLCIVAFIFLN